MQAGGGPVQRAIASPTMPSTSDPFRIIACGAGFAGDRIDPAVALDRAGGVHAIALECLAERTLVPASAPAAPTRRPDTIRASSAA